ncbi:unnamed protein product [Acanthocheilonema viteae]|uniref:Uncharacterized protein n=1 Tax=Acanthocheilonema viteae TaxID=6277 RepID=A0A498SDA7_ACAVI|nr:unnamed protein product [Acanthocheilonema viteae]
MDDVSDIRREIENLWREIVSELNYALSDDCMREMQARNVLKTRYHKFRLSLQGTIDAIKEFAKAELTVVELPSNPFDSEIFEIS